MARHLILVLLSASLMVVLSGCSLVEAYQDVRAVETKLKDNGFENAKVNHSVETKNKETRHTITVAVDRPRNPPFDQKLGTQVADLVILSYPHVKDLQTVTVELKGNGPATTQSRPPSEWRDLVRDFREPAGVNSAVLARDVKGDEFEAVNPTTDFPAEQKIFHAVVAVRNLAPDTTVKAIWTAIDTHGVAPPNQVIVETELKAQGSQRLHFTMEPNAGQLPPGTYKLDVMWDNEVKRTLPFKVAGG
ncbi:MAG: hypothetical protein AB7P40_18735 [Chloroflexota bacterium]